MTRTGGDAPHADFILRGAGELVTMAPGSAAAAEGELGIVRGGALAAREGRIVWVGPERELAEAVRPTEDAVEADAEGAAVTPGFVDAHTHAVFAGSRAAEFEARLTGTSYAEILASGGGINATVRATRQASLAELEKLTAARLDSFLIHGTTTLEIKSGYGLTTEEEIKMLRAARTPHPTRRAFTHLGAHFVPPEYEGRPDAYIDYVCAQMLPAAGELAEFVDVFCDQGAFSVEQARRLLAAGAALGYKLRLHADEIALTGGARLAAELGATSADHLVHIGPVEIQALRDAGVVAVLLPGTSFSLGAPYAPAKALLQAGATVALASDFNPGTCYCENLQMVLALACQGMKLTPSEALRAATIGGAAALGRADQVGSLEVGKWADVLVLVSADHRELGYHFGVNLVSDVIVGGRVVVRDGRAVPEPQQVGALRAGAGGRVRHAAGR
jgi:imidazolonepropionase